ncbi:MAG TPA: biosynthetic arginine decarboxylase [Vulgatibacter sp.]|nr:biosynthetic arginine decarboxylase [Vulgatibacter sp.]
MNAVPRKWTIADSTETYEIRTWGTPFFGVNERGHVAIHPDGPSGPSADLKELVDEVRRRGIGLPLLLRFTDILRKRVAELNDSFARAIEEYDYESEYRGVYPIKVNQVGNVVAEILRAGRPYHYGLEAGSKPELLAVMALLEDPEALIVCNGYKDEEYVESALLASKLDRKVILVVEKLSELPLIAAVSEKLGVRPRIGIRVKLSSRGSGRWEASGGDRSKFGLSSSEIVEAMSFMKERGLLDCFELLHFHLGSQISAIRSFKSALREAGRFFVELAKAGAPLRYFDVGGGLGVDYDGSQTNFASSMNYTMQEYANDIVYALKEICDGAGVPHPYIVSESGRAVVAHHAVLVVDILGTNEFENRPVPETIPEDAAPVVKNLFATFKEVTRKNLQEAYHDAADLKEETLQLFSLGHLPLDQRVMAENIFWSLCHKIMRLAKEQDEMPEELEHLEKALSDTYFCNFSVFQSLPDSWAIDHLFPVMPIHRLAEEPTRRAVLADITCDSDGKIEHFIGRRDVKDVLELHQMNGEDYYLGIFLVGAYQEILGDLHNLFGDTNDVQVSLTEGGYAIDHVQPGDTVTEVLEYVSYNKDDLVAKLRRSAEQALRAGKLTLEESRYLLRAYEEGLAGYTYLERD